MKKLIFILFMFIAPAQAVEQTSASSSVENDYMWQERFKNVMSKAENGIAKAQYSIGEMFEKGRGTQKNIKQAFGWYEKAANQRYTRAQFKVAYLYYKGMGVKKSSNKAFKNFKTPASKGNVRAQYYLGKLYAKGHGVGKDQEKALIWYSRASTGGFGPAVDALEQIKRVLAEEEQYGEIRSRSVVKKKKVTSKSKKANANTTIARIKQKKVTTKANPKKVKVIRYTAIQRKILNGGWKKGSRPAEFLPSKKTNCKKTSRTIMECLSGKLKRNIGTANITYITKAVLYDIKDSGDFKIAYRNKITKIDRIRQTVYDDEDEEGISSPIKLTVKKGWQETEHQLDCKIKSKSTIQCLKNKVRKLKFKNELKT